MGELELMDQCQDQTDSADVVGYGCLLALVFAVVVAGGMAEWWFQRREDREVAAYSLCERCGLTLDESNVHAACAGEDAHE